MPLLKSLLAGNTFSIRERHHIAELQSLRTYIQQEMT